METIQFIIQIVLVICSLALIAVVLMQQGSTGNNVMTALSGNTENFFGRSKAQGREGKLQKLTKIIGIIIAILALAMALLSKLA